MELSRNDTKMLQGLSVLAMVWLHLFDRDYTGLFTPLIFGGVPLSFYIAQLSDFCVFGFAFCSGYGHYIRSEKKDSFKGRLKGLLSVFCTYWLVLIVFSAVSIAAGQGTYMPGSAQKLILNALVLENSYNGAWWYLFAYAVIVLISPLIMRLVKCVNPVFVLGFGFAIYCLAYYVRFRMTETGWLLTKFGPLGMTFFEYLAGAECCKLRVISGIRKKCQMVRPELRGVFAIFVMAALLYIRTKVVPSLFVAPMTGFAVMLLFRLWNKPKAVEKAFLFVGSHSTNIWLTHMFFYSVMFKNLVYIAKYPLIIFAFMLTITIPLSMLLQLVERPVQKRIAGI